MTHRFLPLSLLIVAPAALTVSPALAASEVGTCRTGAGLLVAPWTDAGDPACGEDCGEEPQRLDAEVVTDASLCDDDTACAVEGDDLATSWPNAPEPTGPRCLEAGPECSPGAPATLWVSFAPPVASPEPNPPPSRATEGTILGAGTPTQLFVPCERDLTPNPRPPR